MDNTSVNVQGQVQEAFDNHSNMHVVMEQKWTDKFNELEKMMKNFFKNIEDRNAKNNTKQIQEYHGTIEKNFLAHIKQQQQELENKIGSQVKENYGGLAKHIDSIGEKLSQEITAAQGREQEMQEKLKATDKVISKMNSDHKILRITVQNTQNDIAKMENNIENIKTDIELKISSNVELLQLTAKQFEEFKMTSLNQA